MRKSLLSFIDSHCDEQLNLLEKLINQNSYTLNKPGVDQTGQIIRDALSSCSLSLEIDDQQSVGDNLIFSSPACTQSSSPILLVGHMDTVFPPEHTFAEYRRDQEKAYGPGIIDMKGGLVTAIYLIKALHHHDLLDEIPLVFICNSDEETGSLHSTKIIQHYAKQCLCGLVFECGGTSGEIATGRKGKVGYRLQVKGKAGHAAFAKKNGKVSAVLEAAHKTIALEALNNPDKEIVVNVGKIEGGANANVIADHAAMEIDTRFIAGGDGHILKQEIQKIADTSYINGTTSFVEVTNSRYPMFQSIGNLELFEIVKSQAEILKMEVVSELRSGVSDANTIAECGRPVLDGLGPIGDLDHSEDEYMILTSLAERCKLVTLSLVEIWQSHKDNRLQLE